MTTMTSYRFSDGGRQPCCNCFGLMADHPRSAFHGLNSVLKSLIRWINSSGDIAMYIFWSFGLKLPIHAPFWGVLEAYFPTWRHPSSWPPKGPSLGVNTSFEPFSVRISATVQPERMMKKKKGQDNKSHKSVIFPPIWGETPTGPILPKSCMVGDVHDVITQVSNSNLHDLRFYRGSNFRLMDFCMGLTTVQH